MTDFMPWLYDRYIKPYQEEKMEDSPYLLWLSLMDGELTAREKETYAKVREYFSIQAFLLGLHTGAGLEHSL